jgi:hypothetical protein
LLVPTHVLAIMIEQPFQSCFIAISSEGGITRSILGTGVQLHPQPFGHPQTISIVKVVIMDAPSNFCSVISWKCFSVWLMEKVSTYGNSIFSCSLVFVVYHLDMVMLTFPPHLYLVKLWKCFRVWFVGNVSSSIIFVFLPSLFVYLVMWFSIRELVVDNIIVSIGSKEDESNKEEYLLQMPEKC